MANSDDRRHALVDVEIYERGNTDASCTRGTDSIVPNAARVYVDGTELVTDGSRPLVVQGATLEPHDGAAEFLAVTVTLLARSVRLGLDESGTR